MMKRLFLLLVAILGILSLGFLYKTYAFANAPRESVAKLSYPTGVIFTAEDLLMEANRLRTLHGVAPLDQDDELIQSAQWKAQDMIENDYFGHKKPGESGLNGIHMSMEVTGEKCGVVAENLHENNTGASPFNAGKGIGWVNSARHYAVLLDARYETTGFGYVVKDGRHVFVQHFCDLK